MNIEDLKAKLKHRIMSDEICAGELYSDDPVTKAQVARYKEDVKLCKEMLRTIEFYEENEA